MIPRLKAEVDKGRSLLSQKQFPGEIIENIKDSRDRKEIVKGIFQNNIKYSEASETEKKWRSALLIVQYAFIDYMTALGRFRAVGGVLFIVGFITFVTSFVGMNANLIFGIISIVQGVFFLIISYKLKTLLDNLPVIAFGMVGLLILEVVIFGFPEQFLQYVNDNLDLLYRRGSLIVLANEATPWIYICVKVTVCAIAIMLFLSRKRYIVQRNELESRN